MFPGEESLFLIKERYSVFLLIETINEAKKLGGGEKSEGRGGLDDKGGTSGATQGRGRGDAWMGLADNCGTRGQKFRLLFGVVGKRWYLRVDV